MREQSIDIISTIARHEPELFMYVEGVNAGDGPVALTTAQHPANKEKIGDCLWQALQRGVLETTAPEILPGPFPDTPRFDPRATVPCRNTASEQAPSVSIPSTLVCTL
jgi:hypothetical protein